MSNLFQDRLDEISKKTLVSYANKAAEDATTLARKTVVGGTPEERAAQYDKIDAKIDKRLAGASKAVAKAKAKNESEEMTEAEEQANFSRAMDRIHPTKRDAARKMYTSARKKGLTHSAALTTMHNMYSEAVEESAAPYGMRRAYNRDNDDARQLRRQAAAMNKEADRQREEDEKKEKKETNESELDEALTYTQKHTKWSVEPKSKKEFNKHFDLDKEAEAREHAEKTGGKLRKIDQHGHVIRADAKHESVELDEKKETNESTDWHPSSTVKNPNFNDELSGRRISPPGKRLKSGDLDYNERTSQERIKTLIKFKQKQGGLTGPKSKLPESVELDEKTLTPAELKKREEVAKALERKTPGMDMSKKMAIATAVAKKVAESEQLDELSKETIRSHLDKNKQIFNDRSNSPEKRNKALTRSTNAIARLTDGKYTKSEAQKRQEELMKNVHKEYGQGRYMGD